MVIVTDDDKPLDWVGEHQALARALLQTRVEDGQLSFLNQPTEIRDLRAKLKRLSDPPVSRKPFFTWDWDSART